MMCDVRAGERVTRVDVSASCAAHLRIYAFLLLSVQRFETLYTVQGIIRKMRQTVRCVTRVGVPGKTLAPQSKSCHLQNDREIGADGITERANRVYRSDATDGQPR